MRARKLGLSEMVVGLVCFVISGVAIAAQEQGIVLQEGDPAPQFTSLNDSGEFLDPLAQGPLSSPIRRSEVSRSLEHHVLEEVGQSAPTLLFLDRSCPEAHLQRHGGGLVTGQDENPEAVVERLFEDPLLQLRRGGRRPGGEEEKEEGSETGPMA